MVAPSRLSAFIILCFSLSVSGQRSIAAILSMTMLVTPNDYVTQLTLVEGLYTLQAQLLGYDNPNQLRFNGCNNGGCFTECCDGTGTCTNGFRRCDTFFIFCLRPFGSGNPLSCGSSSGSEMQSNVSIDADATFDFSQSTFLGLSNPLVFQGLTNTWNVSHSAISLSQVIFWFNLLYAGNTIIH